MLCLTPINLRNQTLRGYFLRFVEQFSKGAVVRLDLQVPLDSPEYYVRNIDVLEAKYSAVDAYLWLAFRLGSLVFPDVAEAFTKREMLSKMLNTSLSQLTMTNTKHRQYVGGKKAVPRFSHRLNKN